MSHVKQTDAAKTQILKISFSWIHFLIFLKSQNKKNQATGGAGALARHVARRVIVYGHITLLFGRRLLHQALRPPQKTNLFFF
jgi:hypothetical protein